MKKIKLIVSTILIVSVLFGLVGCKKKLDEVTSEEFVNALEEVVGLSEEDIRIHDFDEPTYRHTYYWRDVSLPDILELCHGNPPSIWLEGYSLREYENSVDARENFENSFENAEEDYGSNASVYLEDDYGYIIYLTDGTEYYSNYGSYTEVALAELESRFDEDVMLIGGIYYYESTVIEVERLSDNEEDIEETRDFLDELGLPHM